MGKKLIISSADFSKNAIPTAKAVSGTPQTQFVYVANVATIPTGFDWDAHKVAIHINDDGTITNFNLPDNTIALPNFIVGGETSSDWLEEIDLSYLSVFPLTTMAAMLSKNSNLKKVRLGGSFNSLTGTRAVEYFINKCTSLENVTILEDFNAPLLSDIRYMFVTSGIISINGLKHLIKSSITNMSTLFYNCQSLKEVDLTGCDTSNVTIFTSMFKNCVLLNSIIGINELDTHSVTNFSEMFYLCTSLRYLSIKDWVISSGAVTTGMFSDATIIELNANCFTSLYGNVDNMFKLTGWNTIHLDNLNDVSGVTSSNNLFSNSVSSTPKVTINNVTNESVKTFLKSKLNAVSAGGSSDWHESTIGGVLCLVP